MAGKDPKVVRVLENDPRMLKLPCVATKCSRECLGMTLRVLDNGPRVLENGPVSVRE